MQCAWTGPSPATLQNIPVKVWRLVGWMVSGKQAKEQVTSAKNSDFMEKWLQSFLRPLQVLVQFTNVHRWF